MTKNLKKQITNLITLLYIPFCIFYAWLNAYWIKHERRIYHGLNGAIHLVAAGLFAWFTKWWYGIAVLLIARVAFDWSLSLMRGLPLGYVSPKPKSIVDRAEKAVFGLNGILPKVIYIVAIIILILI